MREIALSRRLRRIICKNNNNNMFYPIVFVVAFLISSMSDFAMKTFKKKNRACKKSTI